VSKSARGAALFILCGVLPLFSARSQAQTFTISTIAGSGSFTYAGDGGPATAASFHPWCVTLDSKGNLYISDWLNNVVREVAVNGTISTVAGNGTLGYSGDGGAATSAQLAYPCGLAFDAAGDIFIADSANNVIREVMTDGNIATVAGVNILGYQGDGGLATAAELYEPTGLAMDTAGNLYIADSGNNVVRIIYPNGYLTTFAGQREAGYSGDGGPAASAQFYYPKGLAIDTAGNLYVADMGNSVIRKISLGSGAISTVAGNGIAGFSGDGGSAVNAQLSFPDSLAVDDSGNLYIADIGNQRIREVLVSGQIETIAGNGSRGYSGDGGAATQAEFNTPASVAVVSCSKAACNGVANGTLYVADEDNNVIRKLTPSTPPADRNIRDTRRE
jgi:sugar lactone lactonase YvrE